MKEVTGYLKNIVARSARAWIETGISRQRADNGKSHALRVRGLKLQFSRQPGAPYWSHALRVRGLKRLLLYNLFGQFVVARSARAWIETAIKGGVIMQSRVARSARAWIETF